MTSSRRLPAAGIALLCSTWLSFGCSRAVAPTDEQITHAFQQTEADTDKVTIQTIERGKPLRSTGKIIPEGQAIFPIRIRFAFKDSTSGMSFPNEYYAYVNSYGEWILYKKPIIQHNLNDGIGK